MQSKFGTVLNKGSFAPSVTQINGGKLLVQKYFTSVAMQISDHVIK